MQEEIGGGRILAAAVHPKTALGLVELASRLAEPQEDTSISLLTVIKTPGNLKDDEVQALIEHARANRQSLLNLTAPIAQSRNVAISTKVKVATNVESAIYQELQSPNLVRLVLLGWPGEESKLRIPHNIIKEVLINARRDMAVLRNRGIESVEKVLLPFAGGPHSRLALHFVQALAYQPDVRVKVLHLTPRGLDDEQMEDMSLYVHEAIEEELGQLPDWMEISVRPAASTSAGILGDLAQNHYDLMMIGAGGDIFSPRYVFGLLDDALIDTVETSMLIVRRYRPDTAIWLDNRLRRLES